MTILQLLQNHSIPSRITVGDAWMVWLGKWEGWVVYCRPRYKKRTRILYKGMDEEKAVDALVMEK